MSTIKTIVANSKITKKIDRDLLSVARFVKTLSSRRPIANKGGRAIVRTDRTQEMADRTICARLVYTMYLLGTNER